MPLSIIFILALSLGASQSLTAEDVVEPPRFLLPMVREYSIDRIVQFYEEELRFLFDHRLRSVNSLLTLVQELATLNANRLASSARSVDFEALRPTMMNFFSLTRSDPNSADRALTEILQSLFNRAAIDAGLKKTSFDELLSGDQITRLLDAYETERPNEFLRPEQRTEYLSHLTALRDSFFKSRVERYNSLVEFLEEPFGLVRGVTEKLAVFYAKTECLVVPMCVAKIAQLTEFLVERRGFGEADWVARLVLGKGVRRVGEQNNASVPMFAGLLQVFLRAMNNDDINVGKRLFLDFFSRTAFGKPVPAEYQRFIVQKYRREGLKIAVQDAAQGYPELLRLYTLDVLDTSLAVEKQFISVDDMRFIFGNFDYFTRPMHDNLLRYFWGMKAVFKSNAAHLSAFYELFNGLYDAVLLSGPYLVGKFWPQDWSNPGSLFDGFLDALLTWEKSSVWSWWEWQPDAQFFAVNVKTNYFFYKLVNLVANIDHFKANGVVFGNFDDRDDVLVHKFTLLPEYRLFLAKLGSYKRTARGFRYQLFSKRRFAASAVADAAEFARLKQSAAAKVRALSANI